MIRHLGTYHGDPKPRWPNYLCGECGAMWFRPTSEIPGCARCPSCKVVGNIQPKHRRNTASRKKKRTRKRRKR